MPRLKLLDWTALLTFRADSARSSLPGGGHNEGMRMKLLSLAAVLAVTLGGVGAAPADNYPSKPITIVVGFAPGGPTDSSARILAEKMKNTLGQSVIVENQSGAAGTIAYNRVGHAEPDGYTLYLGNWTVNVGAVTMFPVQFDALTGFEPVAQLTTSKLWIVARHDLPANNAKEFVAWLKANPGKANAASVGVGDKGAPLEGR